MEKREDLRSILPYLGVVVEGSSLQWPSPVIEPLKAISRGPGHSGIQSGELLFLAISDLRHSLSLSSQRLSASASHGCALFFDELLSTAESTKWFAEVLPALANLFLLFPSLLEFHYRNADALIDGVQTGLRILHSQQSGIVFLSQELIGALLTCSFFCLFPTSDRDAKHLPMINFDHLFSCLCETNDEKMENKIKCIRHYFERICSRMPTGLVSFERKVLPLEDVALCVTYPKADSWSKSATPLCHFEVHRSGLIEDQFKEALEVDFANRYLGGGALRRGCVQEEIRFMINPELIAGMLFLPSMADNEAIKVVGPESFSNYTGYASSFRFAGDYVDKRDVDFIGRRKKKIIAIDALCGMRMRQYRLEYLLREINKAFCGFFYQSKCQQYQRLFKGDGPCGAQLDQGIQGSDSISRSNRSLQEAPYVSVGTNEGIHGDEQIGNSEEKGGPSLEHQYDVGVVTGNWGCGAFGGDPEIKTTIQWLAASQALRPFISYHTFGVEALKTLDEIMALVVRVPTKIFQQDNPTLFSGGRRQNSAALFSGGAGQSCSVFGRRKLATRISSMSTPQIQHLEKPSASSQHLGLPIMVNGCNGKMGRAVIQAAVSAGLHPVPVSFSCAEESGQTVEVCGKEIKLHGPSGRESILASVVDEYPNLIVVDYTVPDAVNDNAELYCKVGVPFVMGTTGGDRERLYKTVKDSNVYAVISPQMGKQVVAFLAAMEIMAEQFPGAFSGYSLQVMESHQASKLDISGTAKAVISCFQKLGVSFELDQIQQIRDPKQQVEMVGVPEEYLNGHAFHMYHLTSPDQTVSFQFQHNVCGRSIYAEGTVDATIFLAKKIQSGAEQRIYNMIDVLREGNMR